MGKQDRKSVYLEFSEEIHKKIKEKAENNLLSIPNYIKMIVGKDLSLNE